MAVSEIERTELVSRLVSVTGEAPTETLMKCILPEGRDQLAIKNDLKALETELRGEFAELKGEFKTDLAKQSRQNIAMFAGLMLTN